MRYAKLINDYPSYAPRRMKIGSVIVYNPTDEQLLAEGYLPVIETPMPDVDERHEATPHWTEKNGQIVQTWTVEEIPITEEEEEEQALTRYANELTGSNDQTLLDAAETIITKFIEEE